MSFFLTDTTPSAALLDKAETGGLASENDIRAAALELIAKPQAKGSLANFFAEIYRLRELETLEKDPSLFPKFTASLHGGAACTDCHKDITDAPHTEPPANKLRNTIPSAAILSRFGVWMGEP